MSFDPLFFKYQRIPHLGETPQILDGKVEVFEKVDGGNCQVRMIEGRLLAGTRSNFLTREEFFKEPWFKELNHFVLSNYSFYNLPENFVLYGEWTSKHTLDYFPEFSNKFFLLDLFDIDSKKFLPYSLAKHNLEELEIQDVLFLPRLFYGRTDYESLEKLVIGSGYRKGDKEGIVIKDYSNQKFAKLWTSSVKRNGSISFGDINAIMLSLIDQGVSFDRSKLIKEIVNEFSASHNNVPLKQITLAVNDFYSNYFRNNHFMPHQKRD